MDGEATTEEIKGVKAKGASLWGQIIAAVWIGGWHAAQFARDLTAGRHIESTEIVMSGVAIAGCFAPVFLNLFMDKIKEIRAAK